MFAKTRLDPLFPAAVPVSDRFSPDPAPSPVDRETPSPRSATSAVRAPTNQTKTGSVSKMSHGQTLRNPNMPMNNNSNANNRPKRDLRLERPHRVQAAAHQLPFLRIIFGDRDQQQTAPAAADNFHVVIAPARRPIYSASRASAIRARSPRCNPAGPSARSPNIALRPAISGCGTSASESSDSCEASLQRPLREPARGNAPARARWVAKKTATPPAAATTIQFCFSAAPPAPPPGADADRQRQTTQSPAAAVAEKFPCKIHTGSSTNK